MEALVAIIAAVVICLSIVFGVAWLSSNTHNNTVREYRTESGNTCVYTARAIDCDWR